MLRPIDEYFNRQPEPVKSCLGFLRGLILNYDDRITEAWKYGMPFYCFDGKMICYLWTHKQRGHPYLGIVDGNRVDDPDLLQEKRARMKILLVDEKKNVPVKKIKMLLTQIILLRSSF